jgi:hypothetical protein
LSRDKVGNNNPDGQQHQAENLRWHFKTAHKSRILVCELPRLAPFFPRQPGITHFPPGTNV